MDRIKVFMIMPFDDEFFEVFEMLKSTFRSEFEFSNAANEANQQNILKDIIMPLYEADIVIADLTNLNPNVMYELGIAHTFNKKTIIITQDDLGQLPFDLKQYRAKDYNTHFKKFNELIEYIHTNLHGAVTNKIIYSNPVKDFLLLNGHNDNKWFTNEVVSLDITDTERGFLDFMADIEDNMNSLTDNINNMINDLHDMTDGMDRSTKDIEKANKTGGSGTVSFVRKEAKKVAIYIETFSSKLRVYNKSIGDLWDSIERDTLGLLENKYAELEQNKTTIKNFLDNMIDVKESIIKSKVNVTGMKNASLCNMGIERTLNQSIRFLDEDLKTYLDILDRMVSSIEKIVKKGSYLIGVMGS